ncbi:hypothetical protein G6F60_015117 [Rhizopus arrhizus]|nr:hypothetical protein G6F60_015117 [Rhizopus arrhizus]
MVAADVSHHPVVWHALVHASGHVCPVAVGARKLLLLPRLNARDRSGAPYDEGVVQARRRENGIAARGANHEFLLRLVHSYGDVLAQQWDVVEARRRAPGSRRLGRD